jgi:hypothetical protein
MKSHRRNGNLRTNTLKTQGGRSAMRKIREGGVALFQSGEERN